MRFSCQGVHPAQAPKQCFWEKVPGFWKKRSDFGGYVADQMQATKEGLLRVQIHLLLLLVERGHAMGRVRAATWDDFSKKETSDNSIVKQSVS